MGFGFGSGVLRNLYQRTINWYLVKMVKKYLIHTIPRAIIGSLLTHYLNAELLIMIFRIFVFIYGAYLLHNTLKSKQECKQHGTIHWKFGFAAGFLKDLIATGLGNIHSPASGIRKKSKTPTP